MVAATQRGERRKALQEKGVSASQPQVALGRAAVRNRPPPEEAAH